MLGHDQTDSQPGHLARVVRCLVHASLAIAALTSTGLGDESAPALMASEEIRLSGDRIRYWDDAQGVRWVILEGKAAAMQGTEGLRAEAIAVRVEKVTRSGQNGFDVEVHAEGNARTGDPDRKPAPTRRTTLRTSGKVDIRPYERGGLTRLDALTENLPILQRGFPDLKPEPAAAPRVDLATLGTPIPVPDSEEAPRTDPAVKPVQDEFGGMGNVPIGGDDERDLPGDPKMPGILDPPMGGIGDELAPLPDVSPLPGVTGPAAAPAPGLISPNSRRTFTVSGGKNFEVETYPTANGEITYILRGGVNVVADIPVQSPRPAGAPQYQTVDIFADNIVIWTRRDSKNPNAPTDPTTGIKQDPEDPLQLYMEGHVRIRQDAREVAGKGDEKVFDAERAYFDLRTQRLMALDGEFFASTPALLAPLRTKGRTINQYRETLGLDPQGKQLLGPQYIRIDGAMTTGSRFPYPGYRFESQTIEVEDITTPLIDQTTGGKVGPGDIPEEQDKLFQFRAFNSTYYLGKLPIFYLPYTRFNSDFDPILRNIRFQTGNVFGQQIQFDLSAFRLLGIDKPDFIDNWNIDVDYLSYRGVALGSEIGWFGRDLVRDVTDPYRKSKDRSRRGIDKPYYGYLDLWGIQDYGVDNLGPGPSIITWGPPGLGKQGIQRTATPVPQHNRGRSLFRHMQRLVGDDAPEDEDLRFQLEAAYISDRNFLEEYYKRLFDTGLDQETLFYGIYQRENRSATIMAEANLQNWYTDTQWLPKAEYTRLGDAFFNDRVNVSTRIGANYANTHTAIEVNNPNIFAFLPRDPVSNTSGTLETGRAYAAGQVDVPLNFEFLKIVPYAQGQVVGWNNQLGDQSLGRLWGAVGARANILAWRTFTGPLYENELLNIHGLAHKINLQADFRTAYSTQPLHYIGVQDDLDDNTYEYVRRYFALTNYVGGLLPPQYDPRLLTLRRTVSPITGTTDIQDTITTVRFGIHQRLQTKRGKEGQRRIIDYMTLDLDTTYFPNANRDNFGKPFGQNTYNYEWFIGDRTSFTSYGWFEFWDVTGQALLNGNPRHTNDPFGLSVITSGFTISRPPRGSVFIGYSIINTGPIATSALNLSYTYWLSPKWYAYTAMSYDFGNAILLGTTFSITKISKDYLTSVGLTVDPQRSNYTFAFEIAPRFSPNVRFGSTVGQRFDSRFAPSQ